jgi:hypothetical protein
MNNDFEFDSLIKKMAAGHEAGHQAEHQAEHQPELPSPGVIWWRAQILKKQAEAERIERPAKIMRGFAVVISLVVLAGLWGSEVMGIRGIFSVNVFPFTPFLILGAVIGIAFIGVMLWSARLKSQS